MQGVKWFAAPVLATALVASGAGVAIATHAGNDEKVTFEKVSGTHHTNGITTLVIKGDGCLQAEDMTDLRLVEYAPSLGKVVYHCIQP